MCNIDSGGNLAILLAGDFLAEVLIVRNNPPTLANFKISISSWRVFLFYFAARRLWLTSKY